jgi:hypothetical protein
VAAMVGRDGGGAATANRGVEHSRSPRALHRPELA